MEVHIFFGPTAISKTAMAQELWRKSSYPILSVDSRKVYIGADIGTNKRAIKEFQTKNPSALIGGIDLLLPSKLTSVYFFQQYVYEWMETHKAEISKAGGLIIHGGTGLYVDAILEGKTLLSPANVELRAQLQKLSLQELQSRAEEANKNRYENLNQSDRMNPRRLIRVIENGLSPLNDSDTTESTSVFSAYKKIWHLPVQERDVLYEVINKRVLTYFEQGWFTEVKSLLHEYGANAPALGMMGYKQVVAFLQKYPADWEIMYRTYSTEFQTLVTEIQQEHRRYAKRQLTWGKKYLTYGVQ